MTTHSIIVKNAAIDFPRIDATMSFRSELRSLLLRLKNPDHKQATVEKVFVSLNNISFELHDGDRLGLIGPNGAGKTTMLRMLSGAYTPTRGHVEINGNVTTLLSAGLGMDMDQSGYDNIYTCALVLGLPMDRLDEIRADIVDFCELGDHINQPVRTYSSGMLVRLSFAIATAVDPDVLLIDEIIGAGDAKFAEKSKIRLNNVFGKAKILVLASHSNTIMEEYCNKGLFLKNGEIQYFGDIQPALQKYAEWVNS